MFGPREIRWFALRQKPAVAGSSWFSSLLIYFSFPHHLICLKENEGFNERFRLTTAGIMAHS